MRLSRSSSRKERERRCRNTRQLAVAIHPVGAEGDGRERKSKENRGRHRVRKGGEGGKGEWRKGEEGDEDIPVVG